MASPHARYAAGGRPFAGRGIVEFRACKPDKDPCIPPGDQHLAALEERRRLVKAGSVQTASGRPLARGGVVKFRAGEADSAVYEERDPRLTRKRSTHRRGRDAS